MMVMVTKFTCMLAASITTGDHHGKNIHDDHLNVGGSILGLSGLASSSPVRELAAVLTVQRVDLTPLYSY